jgi:hypothetical protein
VLFPVVMMGVPLTATDGIRSHETRKNTRKHNKRDNL